MHLNEDIDNLNKKVIVKASDPEKFVSAITKSAEKLLGNLMMKYMHSDSLVNQVIKHEYSSVNQMYFH